MTLVMQNSWRAALGPRTHRRNTAHRFNEKGVSMNHPAIEASGLSYRYGTHSALQGVDLACAPGRLLALLGPNGAGKTTLVKLLLGVFSPQQGKVRVAGGDPRQRATRTGIGTMLQISGVPENLSVAELADLFASLYPDPLPRMAALGLAEVEDLAKRRFGQLSGGQRQRVLLALALIGQPGVLVLDEPGSGLDPASRRALGELIRAQRERATTVLLCTHDLEEAARLADEVVILDRGRVIASGTPSELTRRLPERRVRCRTNLNTERLAALPGCCQVSRDGDVAEILVRDVNPFLQALLAADPLMSDLGVAGASLEDAFLTLTHPPLKEAA
ncbi:MAG: ABC transporter ATP-binding protein [Wenzhouxiangella sp.]|nr:MAG: ABC transporter ATP-binding protein [Wenzhouxiangella sp.]